MDDNKNAMRNTRQNKKKIDRKIMGKSNEIEQNR